MRELKFKAVNKKTGEVIENIAIDTNSEHIGYWIDEENYTWVPMAEFDIYEYTGLKDKNQVPIYEGDIISILDEEEFDGWNEEVIFHRSCFMAGDDNLLVNVHFRSVVKGNIYENPNLLEGDSIV